MGASNPNDPLNYLQNPKSRSNVSVEFSSIHIGIVTSVDAPSRTATVLIPSLNDTASLGPYRILQPFTNAVTTPIKQTVTTTSAADPQGGATFLTSASLSASTTDLSGAYGALSLPSIGNRVLVVLLNDSLDEGVVVGAL